MLFYSLSPDVMESPSGVVANKLDHYINLSGFESHSCNAFRKLWTPLFLQI